MDKFRSKTLSGLLWTSGGQFARQLLSFGVWVGFARLLTQKEFGVNNMITVLEGFLEIAAELGLGAALIQRSALRQEHLASAFWATLATGLGAMILFAACGPIFSSFYREPSLVALSLFVAFSLPAGTLKVVQYSILSREMKFRTLAVAEITALVISGGISLTLAFWGFGVWSLAASFVINDVMFTLLLWLASPWRPSLQFDRAALKELLLFGVPMTGTQMIGHTAISIDSVLVGRFFGPAPLGLYTLALSIVVVPVNNVFQVVNRVIFPAFSLIQEDKARIKELYLKFSGAIMLLVAPVYLGLAVTAGPAVQFIFGEKWIEAVPILQVFCLRGLLGLVGGMNTNLFLSQGRADLRLRVIFFFRFLTIVAVFVGLYWSVMGVAWSLTAVACMEFLGVSAIAGGLVGVRLRELLSAVTGCLVSSAIMAGLVAGLDRWLPSGLNGVIRLAIEVPAGVLIYLGLIHFGRLKAYRNLLAIIKDGWRKRMSGGSAA